MRLIKTQIWLVLLLLVGSVLPAAAVQPKSWSSSDGVYYLPTSDSETEEYTVDGTITFKGGATSIPYYKDNGVVFSPKNAGDVIVVTVNSITLTGDSYLLVYDGAKSGFGDYNASDGTGQSKYMPAGWVKKYQEGSAGETYTSQSTDGKLTFGYHNWASGSYNFDITVQSVTPTDMEFVSAGAMTDLASVNRGARDKAIFGVTVSTKGSLNALTLDELTVGCSALQGSTQVSNVRLYKGDKVADDALLATAATVGADLTATGVTLRSGDNQFLVVADIDPNASGTIPSLTLSSVKVGGVSRDIATATGTPVTVTNEILMGTTPTTYVISEATPFYDDGGKDGKITLKFDGQVTFVPADAGKSIKVDFTTFKIFNTSSVGYNDEFKFYNGRSANADSLITTLLTESEIVKSTAPDGSMTVTLKSTTGVAADGWEATVSQFTPGPMTLNSVSAVATDTTAASGDAGVRVMTVDVLTDNQTNPLSVTDLALTLSDAKNVKTVHVYYLGTKNTFATTNELGSVAVSGTDVKVTGEQALAEGHNYFAVVLDLNDGALNGETATITLGGITVAGTVQAPAQSVAAKITIKNVCHLYQGTHSHIIADEWEFTDTKSAYNSSKYEYENATYQVTFTPQDPSCKAQLDFTSFDVYYSSNSWGTKAQFEVYSGTTATTDNLLWSLTSADQAATGPGKTLRSTAADGSLTIVFNPKTSAGYYAGTGWKAIVKPFKNHDMSIDEVNTNQTGTGIVPIGTKNAKLIDFDVVTEGTLTTMTVESIGLRLTGAEALDSVSVLYSAGSSDIADAVSYGKVAVSGSDLTVTGSQALNEGSNHFWVLADVKADAQSGTTVDAALTAINGEKRNGDPEGNITLMNLIYMQPDTNVVIVNGTVSFYDDGGPDNYVTKGFKGVTIFKPGKADAVVKLTTNKFTVGGGKFYLYNGSEISDDNLIGTYNYTSGPGTVISSAADGALTVKFEAANSSYSNYNGFDMELSLYTPTAHVVDTVLAEPIADATVIRGESGARLLKVTVAVGGDRGSVKLNDFKFATTGTTSAADVKAMHLYYTASRDGFTTTQELGSVASPTGEFTITAAEPIEISDKGHFYLWLTCDVAADATAGNTIAAALTGVSVADTAFAPQGTAATTTVKAGIKGNYVIGSSAAATYPTFAAATAALEGGVEGPVTFEVEDGTYAENVTVSQVKGAGPDAPISFVGQSGDRSKVVITGAGYSSGGYGSHAQGLFFIDSTSYVTLRHMSIVPTDQTYPAGVHVYNQSRHVTIDSVAVTMDPITSGYSSVGRLIYAEAVNEEGKNNDYLTVTDCKLYGGYIALYLGGTGYVALSREQGLVVSGNTISESGSKGIYVTDEDNALITGNTVTQSTTQKTGYWGIDLYRQRGAAVVAGNSITTTSTPYSGGIYLRSQSRGTAEQPILIYNNVVNITNSPTGSTAGIEMDGDQAYITVAYNTVRIGGTKGYAFYTARDKNNPSYKGIVVKNNLLQSVSTEGVPVFIYSDYVGLPTLAHNAYISADSTVMASTSLADYATTWGDTTSFVEAADFVSETDLRLKTAGNLQAAEPLSYVTTDITGRERDAQKPTIGAYEFVDITALTPDTIAKIVAVAVTDSSITFKSQWNVSGQLYSVIRKADAASTAPAKKAAATADELLAAEPVSYTAQAEATTVFTGLEPSTPYQAYFLLVSALDGAKSSVVATDTVTTLQHIDTLKLVLSAVSDSIVAGGSAKLEPLYAGGLLPYTYEWRNQMNEVVGTDSVLTVTPDHSQAYRFTVTSADGQSATDRTAVIVEGKQFVANFDDNYLAAESHWCGDKEEDVIYSGSFAFNSGNMPEYNYWWGYALSNSTSTTYASLADQFNATTGTGHSATNFCVVYPQGTTIDVTNAAAQGDSVSGFYITNNAYAMHSMTTGDSYSKAFTQGSWLKLTVTGTAADGTSKSLDYYLGDYRSSVEADHYLVDTWQWVDLRELGKVKSLSFTMDGSDTGKWGLNTPAYFVMDDLGGQPDMTEAARSVSADGGDVLLSELFTTESDGSTVTYAIESVSGTDAQMALTLTGDKIVAGESEPGTERVVIVLMTQKGKTQRVRLRITSTASSAVTEAQVSEGVKVWPVPVTDRLNVATAMPDYTVQVFTATGACVAEKAGCNGTTVIARDGWAPGVYVVRVSSAQGSVAKRIVVK